jgi:hypothetical protein
VVVLGASYGVAQRDVLRTRALIIVDDQGRERIALGAPIPDLEAGERDSPANGLVILGENGKDHLVLGSPTPDPVVSGKRVKRIFPASGLQLNDLDGNERGGFSYLHDGRVVLGLDRPGTGEGVALFVLKEGHSGIWITGMDGRQRAFFGPTGSGSFPGWIRAPEGSPVLVLHDSARSQQVGLAITPEGWPRLEVLGAKGRRLLSEP